MSNEPLFTKITCTPIYNICNIVGNVVKVITLVDIEIVLRFQTT